MVEYSNLTNILLLKTLEKLGPDFYVRANVVKIAAELIGKILVTEFEGIVTAGRIVETEAYAGKTDMASHARKGLRTPRTAVMYKSGGIAYVYLCYGIHHLFNVVTNKENIPHAVLIRSLEPLTGIEWMLKRTGKKNLDFTLTRGPGNVAKALGLFTHHNGSDLTGTELYILKDDFSIQKKDILATKRIGVAYAGKDADLPYRFILKNNQYVSGLKK